MQHNKLLLRQLLGIFGALLLTNCPPHRPLLWLSTGTSSRFLRRTWALGTMLGVHAMSRRTRAITWNSQEKWQENMCNKLQKSNRKPKHSWAHAGKKMGAGARVVVPLCKCDSTAVVVVPLCRSGTYAKAVVPSHGR